MYSLPSRVTRFRNKALNDAVIMSIYNQGEFPVAVWTGYVFEKTSKMIKILRAHKRMMSIHPNEKNLSVGSKEMKQQRIEKRRGGWTNAGRKTQDGFPTKVLWRKLIFLNFQM